MAKTRRKRHSYSNAKRISILQAAREQGLTALDVKKRFGVTPVTYYSWRRKYGAGPERATTVRVAAGVGRAGRAGRVGIAGELRNEVQSRVREILPQIVRNEVSNYLDSLFGSSRGRGRKI
jgi:transposase-like protein